jgi:hypothetical protein
MNRSIALVLGRWYNICVSQSAELPLNGPLTDSNDVNDVRDPLPNAYLSEDFNDVFPELGHSWQRSSHWSLGKIPGTLTLKQTAHSADTELITRTSFS